jgi:signal transduction histidine kinase
VEAAALATLLTRRWLTVAGVVALVTVFYLLGRWRSRRMAVLLVLPLVVCAVVPFSRGTGGKLFAILVLALTAGAAAVGVSRRVRDERRERAASTRVIADTLMEHAARGERARIARELHDVVAHHISMIAVQAETARLTTPGMPAEGAKRLAAIGDTARQALTEMRRLLGVLREDAGAELTRKPQPGLQQLNELIDEARDSVGTSTRLIVRGHVVPLGPGVELTAYRIVQEALTNARRHAPGSAVDVELEYAEEELRLRVRDNGPGLRRGAVADGHGLLGMRERAATVGGTLLAGPASAGGFVVEAVLPVAEVST